MTWQAPACGYDDRILTGHLPSPITPEGHFWGWHTSPDENLEEACSGEIIDFTPYPPGCWDYGNWSTQPWLCDEMPPFPPVHMAFTLLTSGVPGDCTDDWLVDLADYEVFALCMTGPDGGPVEPGCQCADLDIDGDVDLIDFGLFQGVFDTP